jgi:hypothetical protein
VIRENIPFLNIRFHGTPVKNKVCGMPQPRFLFNGIVILSKHLSPRLFSAIFFNTDKRMGSSDLQVIDLLVGDRTLRTGKHLKSILVVAKKIMESSVIATVEKKKRESKMDISWVLIQPSRLFLIAVSFLKQLNTELSDTTANNLMVQNLAYAVRNLHMLIRRSTSSHQFWSSISSSNHGAFLKGFELLGSTKAKNTFLLCTSTSSDVAGSSLDTSEEPTSLLVSSIAKRM